MLTQHHLAVFLITFVSFSLYHVTRKTFGSTKDLFSKEWSPTDCNKSWPCPEPESIWINHNLFESYKDTEPFLGLLDLLFSFAYAIGLFFSGVVGERVNMRLFLSFGMSTSAMLLLVFGSVTEWCNIYSKPVYVVLWFIQGIVQSIGWPVVVTVMGNWFDKSSRGLIFGIWSSSAAVGNIIGSLLTAAVLEYGYEVAFFTSSCMFFFASFVVYFGLVCSPEEIGLPSTKECLRTDTLVIQTDINETNTVVPEKTESNTPIAMKSISFKKALFLPGVIAYSLLFACLKTINYAFYFWLPFYFVNNFDWSDKLSSQISSWYDVGGIFGGIVFGIISDRLYSRTPVLVFMIIMMPIVLFVYTKSPNNVAINSSLLVLTGIFVNGSSNIVGSAVTADVGKQTIDENVQSLSTVTGIIDGIGTLGVALGQLIISQIMYRYGWGWVFNFLIIISVAAILCILQIFIKEKKLLQNYFTCQRHNPETEPLLS